MSILKKISTSPPKKLSKKKVKKETAQLLEKMHEYQKLMFAQEKYSLLIVLQGMDASGKDGTIRTIFSGINPLWCRVYGFKKPTSQEAAHDFLWRVHKNTPGNGMIHIFNRSHYEDILVPSVEKTFPAKVIEQRYEHINNFEKLVSSDNNTRILKFYLHISPEEQKKSLEDRMINPQKHRKHNDGDRDSRAKWDKYMKVYERIFKKCNDKPRHIIPSDKNWYKVNLVTKAILAELETMDLGWPELETDLKAKVKAIKKAHQNGDDKKKKKKKKK